MKTISELLGSQMFVEQLKKRIVGGVEQNIFHKMIICSVDDEEGTLFGQLVLINGINNREYIFERNEEKVSRVI